MDLGPELKTLLTALAEGQVRLAEGQVRTDAAIAHLATATEAAIQRLVERVDDFGRRVTVGFTNGANLDRKLEDEVRGLEARVAALEKRSPPKAPPRKRR